MTHSSFLDANTVGIGALLSLKKRLRVPLHQRDFAWSADEVGEFFEDITEAFETPSTEYFMGLVVLVGPDDHGWSILDGQQRLATTTMLFSAMRGWLREHGKEQDAAQIDSEYIAFRRLGETQEPRLTLNVANAATFSSVVVPPRTISEVKTSARLTERGSTNWLLLQGALQCRQMLDDWLSKGAASEDTQTKRLYALQGYLENGVKVVCLEVARAVDAYVVFESLNFRGHDLSVLDLVKNYLFSEVGTDGHATVTEHWSAMQQAISASDADDFLRVVWTSRFGRIQRGQLFRQVRTQYSGPDSAAQFAQLLSRAAPTYVALEEPTSRVWWERGSGCSELIEALRIVRARQIRPIVLAFIDRFPKTEELASLLWLLLVLTVRYQTIGKRRTGALEIGCARAAHQIASGRLSSPLEVLPLVQELAPSDEEFMSDLRRYSESKPERVRLMLSFCLAHQKDPSIRGIDLLRKSLEFHRAESRYVVGPHFSLTLDGRLPSEEREAARKSLSKLGNWQVIETVSGIRRTLFPAAGSDIDVAWTSPRLVEIEVDRRQELLASSLSVAWSFHR